MGWKKTQRPARNRPTVEALEDRCLLSTTGWPNLRVITQPPASVVAGTPFGFSVEAENADGSVDTSFNGVVNVSSDLEDPVGGTTLATAVDGMATFSRLTEEKAGSDYLLVGSEALEALIGTANFQVTPAAATQTGCFRSRRRCPTQCEVHHSGVWRGSFWQHRCALQR